MNRLSFASAARHCGIAALALLLAACGGGGGGTSVAGVGSGGTGVVSGSVSGFGSIIVDGVEYDDSNATRQTQDADGAGVNAAVKLGQRVRLVYAGANVAQSIEVQAQLAGPVTAAAVDGTLAVMGQTVRIVADGADASQSTPTVLDGYAAAAAIAAGDDVEVHGAWVYDTAAAAHVLVATRIEKLAEAADPVQLGGVVVAIDGTTVRLNAAAGSRVQAAALPALEAGDVVRVWAARAALAGTPVQAGRVAGNPISAADLANGGSVILSGLASRFDAATRTIEVQGVRVRIPEGVAVDAAALARGEFVTVEMHGGGTALVASAVKLRSGQGGADLGRTVQVNGVTSGIEWSAATVEFALRNATIRAAAAVIDDSCRVVGPLANVYVQVRGTLAQSSAVVTASEVRCLQTLPGMAMASYAGTLNAINLTTQTLTITTGMGGMGGHALHATWDARTYFQKHPASLPIGLRVEVEGVLVQGSNTLRLSRVSLAK